MFDYYDYQAIGEICDAIKKFRELAGKPKRIDTLRKIPSDLLDKMDKKFGTDVTSALSIGDKHKRGAAVGEVETKIATAFTTSLSKNEIKFDETILLPEIDLDAPVVAGAEEAEDIVDLSSTPSLTEVLEEDEASELYLPTSLLDGVTKSTTATTTKSSSAIYDPIDVKVSRSMVCAI